jgi:hypothetical protein
MTDILRFAPPVLIQDCLSHALMLRPVMHVSGKFLILMTTSLFGMPEAVACDCLGGHGEVLGTVSSALTVYQLWLALTLPALNHRRHDLSAA